MSARGKRVLVTGITGQDGSYLAERLVADGHHVIGVVRAPLERELPDLARVRAELELVAGDLSDPEALGDVVRAAKPDLVYHLAAPTFVPASWEAPATTMKEIVDATAAVLIAGRDLGARVLVPTSPEIYGYAGGESPQTERSVRLPRSPYGVAKLAAHELVRVLREGADPVHAVATVTYNHESPRRPVRFVTRKITRAAAEISLGRAKSVSLGSLDAQRDWSHARDIVDGMVRALEHDTPDDYVLASGEARTVGDFARAAFAAVGLDADEFVTVNPEFVRPPEPTVLVGDPSHARKVLGWRPTTTFEGLVAEMVEADLAELRAGR